MTDLSNASRVGRLTFLSDSQKQQLYEAALEILGRIGMSVLHPGAKALLLSAGAEELRTAACWWERNWSSLPATAFLT